MLVVKSLDVEGSGIYHSHVSSVSECMLLVVELYAMSHYIITCLVSLNASTLRNVKYGWNWE